ncbi:MAG TPA: heme-binding protein [Pseudomonadales bacterium]|nr:heme-binding protein [Pseudomonadales bacterium]
MRLLILLSLFYAMTSHAEPSYYNDYETLRYEVLATYPNDIEIRRYQPAVAVSTRGTTQENAFNLLFKYITGANVAKQSIDRTQPSEQQSVEVAMTTPVEMQKAGNGQIMRFFLPSQYTLDTAPQPIHPAVYLEERPAQTVAAIRYSGYNNDKKIAKHEKLLRDLIAQENYQVVGDKTVFGYDAPWRLWWLRRNEVILPITME